MTTAALLLVLVFLGGHVAQAQDSANVGDRSADTSAAVVAQIVPPPTPRDVPQDERFLVLGVSLLVLAGFALLIGRMRKDADNRAGI